jgi:DNA modification methylase
MSFGLAHAIIQYVASDGAVLLDPMAGSGTVLAAARTLNHSCYAFDIDPLASILLRVISRRHDIRALDTHVERVSAHAATLARDRQRLDRRFEQAFDAETQQFINFWFPAQARRGLLALVRCIEGLKDEHAQDVLTIIFSRLIIAKTTGVSRAIDLPHTRPHRNRFKPMPDPLVIFRRRAYEVLKLLQRLTSEPVRIRLCARQADARRLPLKEGVVDLVLTSSPYANAIDYMRAHKFTLVWLGYSVSELRALRAQMIGTERSQQVVDGKLSWLEACLPTYGNKEGSRQGVLRRYFYDMHAVLSEMYRVLRPGGASVLVLGKSRMDGHVVDIPAIATELGKRIGFRYLGTRYRVIPSSRRALPFGVMKNGQNPLDRRMAEEAVVCLGR